MSSNQSDPTEITINETMSVSVDLNLRSTINIDPNIDLEEDDSDEW